jgi:HD-like signal output (HDOD) protein
VVVRILFVDDDWDELEVLRLLTRHKRDEWDVAFACGYHEAIRHLTGSKPPDVVVSEVQLDGLGGIELLKTIQSNAPHSIRILYSRDRSTMAICRSIPWAHQFLAKPIDLAVFESTIAYLRADPTAHESHSISQLAASADTLPVLPPVYQRVVDIAATPDFSLRQIAEAIQDDVALTAETMKVVNSSFFGLLVEVTSIEQAVSLLGLDVIRGLILASSLFDESTISTSWLDLAALADQSQHVGSMARAIAKLDGHPARDQAIAFLSGMVHGAGLLLLTRCDVNIPAGTDLLRTHDLQVDKDLFGIDRFALGAYLLRLWAFEHAIVEAVAGLGVPSGVVSGPIATSLRDAHDVMAVGGFSVAAFVQGEPDAMAAVKSIREQLDAAARPIQTDVAA